MKEVARALFRAGSFIYGEFGSDKKEVEEIMATTTFSTSEEKASLQLLINELEKINDWLSQLVQKVELLSENVSWKQFLQREKII